MLKTAMDHVFRRVGFVSLWNDAVAGGESLCRWRGKVRKCGHGKVADGVGMRFAVPLERAGGDKRGLGAEKRYGEKSGENELNKAHVSHCTPPVREKKGAR